MKALARIITRALRKPTISAALSFTIAFAATLALFWPVVGHARILALGDALNEALPGFFASNERWQPAMLVGFPIYADSSKAFWNPLRLLRYAPNGFNVYVIASYGLAAWATYAYVRGVTGLVVAGIATAVTFASGGFMISHAGHPMIAQPAAWACVALWSLDVFLRHGRGRWLFATATAEALSFVSGQPQIGAFAIVLLLAYLIWFGYEGRSTRTLRIYFEGISAIVLGVVMAAIALLPTIALSGSSVRSGLDYRAFVADSLPLQHLARMMTYPFAAGGGDLELYRSAIVQAEVGLFTETTCYVGLAALALGALGAFAKHQRRLAFFWSAVACVALILAVGDALPTAALTFGLPGFNLFRIPGRHAFEFTLAASVCAGLGVSAIAHKTERRFVLPLALSVVVAIAAIATVDIASEYPGYINEPAFTVFVASFLLEFVLLCIVAATHGNPALKAALACSAILAGSLPFSMTAYWRDAPTAHIIARPGYVRILERLPIYQGQRVYAAGDNALPELQANLPTIWGVPDVGGYTPLQFATVHVLLQTGANGRLLNVTSPMVDLAAVRYFAVPARQSTTFAAAAPYDSNDLQMFLSRGRPEAPREAALGIERPVRADRIVLVTALGASVNVTQGRTEATLTLREQSGKSQTIPVRAGIETAELAYERSDVLATIRHRRAHLYERLGSVTWYDCSLPIRLHGRIASIAIRMLDPVAALNIRKISLVDTTANRAYPFSDDAPFFADKSHFKYIARSGGVALFENLRAMPSVWIARAIPTAVQMSDDTSLAAFRESLHSISYREEAFMTDPQKVPKLAVRGTAKLVIDEGERRDVEASCTASCLLVSSETYTDDWNVVVDGHRARLIRVDGMLQGVIVPPGHHKIEFRFEPFVARCGVALSTVATMVLLL